MMMKATVRSATAAAFMPGGVADEDAPPRGSGKVDRRVAPREDHELEVVSRRADDVVDAPDGVLFFDEQDICPVEAVDEVPRRPTLPGMPLSLLEMGEAPELRRGRRVQTGRGQDSRPLSAGLRAQRKAPPLTMMTWRVI